MTTGNIDVKNIARLPDVWSWRGVNLSRKLALKLFSGLKHGSLTIHDNGVVYQFGSGDLSIAPAATVTIAATNPLCEKDRGSDEGQGADHQSQVQERG